MFYILEYYYYDIIDLPVEVQKQTSSKKCNQALMLYPELLFSKGMESPTIIEDYINRYIPSFNG